MKKGWGIRPLGDLLEIQNGFAFDSKRFSTDSGTPLIRIRDLKNGYTTETNYIGDYDERFLVSAGDLLIGMDGEFRCYEWLGDDALLNQRVCRLQNFHATLEPRFILYGVNSYLKEIEDATGFTTVKHLSAKRILGIEFPIPPLPEQRRIVAILDEAFEGIAAAKANAEQNLRNAREVFEGRLADLFCGRGYDRPIARLGDVCGFQGGSQPPKSKFQYAPAKGLVRFLQIRDFASDRNVTFIPESDKNRLCEADDIMLGRYGASVGKVLTGLGGAYNVALIKTIPDQSRISKRYLYHYLTSPAFQSPLRKVAARSAQDGFSREDINPFALPLPSLAEQAKTVEMLDSVEAECDLLGQQYKTAAAALDQLKASLLHQAFTGAL